MLPQFPKAQKLIEEFANEAMFDAMYEAGPLLLEIRSHQQHEGKDGSFQTNSGQIEQIDFRKTSVAMTSPVKQGRGETLEEILKVMTKGGSDMGRKIQDTILQGVEAATENVGNVIQIRNNEITPEAFLEMMEKVEIDFDEDGRSRSSWFLPQTIAAELHKSYEAWQEDPILRTKLAALEAKKKEEFRAREVTRRLAR